MRRIHSSEVYHQASLFSSPAFTASSTDSHPGPVYCAVSNPAIGLSLADFAAACASISAGSYSVALLASYLPARRAVRIEPMAALRCE